MAAVLTIMGVAGIGGWQWVTHWRPSPARFPLQGVDLAEDASVLQWASVRAAGADFAYLVATIGPHRRAPSFEANWQALPDAGLRRGAVHLFDPCEDARTQADAFNTVVPRVADALPAAIAVEVADGCTARPDLTEQVRRFAAAVETHSGKPILLRVSRAAERAYHLSGALDRPVWVMGTFLVPGYATHPWRLWRATALRHVDGVEGPVNWDVVAP